MFIVVLTLRVASALLYSDGGASLVQQGAVGMPQRMPSEASNAHLFAGGTQVILLDFVFRIQKRASGTR
jgi:hypothetical protein